MKDGNLPQAPEPQKISFRRDDYFAARGEWTTFVARIFRDMIAEDSSNRKLIGYLRTSARGLSAAVATATDDETLREHAAQIEEIADKIANERPLTNSLQNYGRRRPSKPGS